ncbi:hypothetical protein EW146_g5581 [Bondarzewia mesenterica]|uniref:Carboxypeptidase n=1 Tax=Bondarzewia mesenterica TaxID=1095465 RepID=A0A4S4LR17_9AGAM|nr:hypothetical protein EW146_g5581 [Bondarzewia mesenterica]
MGFLTLFTLWLSTLSFFIAARALAPAARQFHSAVSDVNLRIVKNSGVCETTPGVGQISGYIDVGTNMSMVRSTPSVSLEDTTRRNSWFTQTENGPCQILPDGQTTVLNPHSWNTISNMIYIDQPIGTGFSFGTDTVNSTEAAAPFVWKAFQVLFESGEFSKFASREFIFATESYGGHYGPSFVTYFDQQNALINSGKIQGEKVVVSALMINNGWYDPLLQNEAYVTFATNAPGYGPLQNASVLAKLNKSFFESGGCKDQEIACEALGNTNDVNATANRICKTADDFCVDNVFVPAVGDRDSDDLRQKANSPNPFPPEFYLNFLANETIKARIGATSTYSECADPPFELFDKTGDDARSWLPELSALANSRLKLLIWAGDADINCNWLGGHASVLAMDWYGNQTLHATPFTIMTINGTAVAAVQNVDNFSFARVFAAGHEVPAFQPQTALEIFSQVIKKELLHSVSRGNSKLRRRLHRLLDLESGHSNDIDLNVASDRLVSLHTRLWRDSSSTVHNNLTSKSISESAIYIPHSLPTRLEERKQNGIFVAIIIMADKENANVAEILRPVGLLEQWSTVRHDLGYYWSVGMTTRYYPPASKRLSPGILYSALKVLISQHSTLGASIIKESTLAPQFVRLRRIDLSKVVSFVDLQEGSDREHQLDKMLAQNHSIPFKDLGSSPLWRLVIVIPPTACSQSVHGVDVALFVHHAIADGGSATIFHQSLLSALNLTRNEDLDPIVDVSALHFLPPLHELLSMPTSWIALGKALYNSWFPSPSPSLWTGPPISSPDTLTTQTIHFSLSPSSLSKITAACKANQTSWTALLESSVAKAFFESLPTDGTADELACCCALSLKRFISIVDATQMGVYYASDTHYFRRAAFAAGASGLWDAARRTKVALDAKIAAGDRDQDTGMLRYVSSVRNFVINKIGKKRDASFEISNVGIVRFNESEDDQAATAWKAKRVLFSQSANAVGAPIAFSVCSVKGGDICVSASWQVGVVDSGFARSVMTNTQALLEGLV